MNTHNLVLPDGSPIYTADSLFGSDNGEIICNRHYPVATKNTGLNVKGGPSSDFRWTPLDAATAAEWTAFVHANYGADASPCETCRFSRIA